MKQILQAIEDSKAQLGSEQPDELALARAQEVLEQARACWRELEGEERQVLSRPAWELKALLENQGAPITPELLLSKFGLSSFRPGQREAVVAALEGRDSLIVMPTGGGKSLCYQLPALAGQGLVVVVSPLIALMADQLGKLRAVGVQASMLASGMRDGHNSKALAEIAAGKTRLVLAAPERFASGAFRKALSKRKVSLFVVDEAHCVAEWGHDFRPDYLRLHDAITMLGHPPVMAATATATPAVANEIAKRLELRDWVHVSSGFDRPNLTFDVVNVETSDTADRKRVVLLRALREKSSRPAIVYCGTRKDTETVAAMLSAEGMSTVSYHAGMQPRERESAQTSFMGGHSEVVVATNAFGMGVDKADVRTVVHWAIPTSLETYYQEAGRAGRDGQPAQALLFASHLDLGRLIRFNNQRNMSVEDVQLYLGSLKRQSRSGALELTRMEQKERLMLSVAERSGALRLEPGDSNAIKIVLTGKLDTRAAYRTIQEAKDRGWDAYRAIERFISNHQCRRRQILDFFGDQTAGSPVGRCCDVCGSSSGLLPDGMPSVVSESAGPDVNEDQLAELRAWRAERAQGKPVHVVATDATLREVLERRPSSTQALLKINGIGPSFCKNHGESLLKALGTIAPGKSADVSMSRISSEPDRDPVHA